MPSDAPSRDPVQDPDAATRANRATVARILESVALPAGEAQVDARDLQSAEELLPILYDELRALARSRLARERPGQTLQPTALVHEAWLRLVGDGDPGWHGRAHFFGSAARAMRRILVEQARRKGRIRHGGDQRRVELDHLDGVAAVAPTSAEVLAVDQALRRLEARDPRKGKIVELRWFAGLTTQETAEVLGVSVGTVERDWRFLRAWLRTELDAAPEVSPPSSAASSSDTN